MGEPEKVGLVINKFETFGKTRKGREIQKIRKKWSEIAGKDASMNSKPTKVSRGTLFIVARDAPWSTETSMYSGELLRRIRDITGIEGIKKVRIRTDKKSFLTGNIKKEELREQEVTAAENEKGNHIKDNITTDDEIGIALNRYIRSMRE
ncbi:MAG: DUF721 domain-containing protein [Actinobacteria bacterium]|nr:DUF721 domain-containing protein [Actinomycetota bacterium]